MSSQGAGSLKIGDSKVRTWTRVGLLALFVILSAWMYNLNLTSHPIWQVSGQYGLSFFLCVLFLAAAIYEVVSLVIHGLVRMRGGSAGEITMLTSFIRVVAVLAVVLALLQFTGTLKGVGGIVAGFAGMLLGWSLQAPVSGVAAWALVTLKRPFRVGDRVLFPTLGLLGDVLDVGFMYTKLNQVGGAVGSEEAIGRYILIPNAMLFSQVAINYTPQQVAAYSLDEVIVRLTFDSDWDTAEKILLDAAREVTREIISETGKEPYIRSDIYDYGVLMRLRYMTYSTDRPRVSHEILKRIFRDFQRTKRVDFAIPFVYSYRKGMEAVPRGATGPEPITEVPIENIDDPEAHVALTAEEQAAVEELAGRIETMGLLQPIVVRQMDAWRYLLLVGRFRLLACKHLGWKAIPAIVKEGDTGRMTPEGENG